MKAPKYVVAPEVCADHLTPGKTYAVHEFCANDTYGGTFHIDNDYGDSIFCLLEECGHLNGGNWIIPDDDADDADDADGEPKTTKPRVTAVRVGDITVDCDENPNDICISDGPGDYIIVPRANIPALIEALKMMVAE